MAVWLVRAGRHDKHEDLALDSGLAMLSDTEVGGWLGKTRDHVRVVETPTLSKMRYWAERRAFLRETK